MKMRVVTEGKKLEDMIYLSVQLLTKTCCLKLILFFILCRSTMVRSFETIPESTKIESEICVINTKVSK